MNLARRAAGSAAWVAGTAYLNQIITFLANVALMRLIAPEAFGVLALAVFFCTLARKVTAFGFNYALIHRSDRLPEASGAHLGLQILSAALVMVMVVLSYPLVAAHYDALTAAVLIGVAIGAAFENVGTTPRVLLEKDVDFRRLQIVNTGINVGINAIACLGALLWPNVWVLLVRLAGAQIAGAVGYWYLNPRPPMRRPSLAMFRWYLRFGAPLWLGGIATFAVLQFDDFLVGTLISAKDLGFYTRAYQLAVLPTTMVTHIIARVAFPLYSKVQGDRARLSRVFGMVMRVIVLFSAPAAVGLFWCAPEFVNVVFGEKWQPMVLLVRLLIVYQLMRPIFDDVGELFAAVGAPRAIGRIQIAQALAMIATATPVVYFFQAEGAAIAASIVMLVGVILAYRRVGGHVTIDYRGIFVVPIVSCFVAAGIGALVLWRWPVEHTVWRLLAKIGLFGGTCVLLLAVLQGRRFWQEFQYLRGRLKEEPTL